MMWTVFLALAAFTHCSSAQDFYGWEEEPESDHTFDDNYATIWDGSGSGDGEVARGQFAITIKQKFRPQLLNPSSVLFTRVSNDLVTRLNTYLSNAIYVSEDDFTVEVMKFEPGPGIGRTQTRAIVDIEFLSPHMAQQSELEFSMEQLIGGRLGRTRVIDVTVIPILVDVPAPVVEYQALITYSKAFNNQLKDPTSRVYRREKKAIEAEILLQMVIKHTLPETDIDLIEVKSFKPARGRRSTSAVVNMRLSNMDESSVQLALSKLVGLPITGKRITRAAFLGVVSDDDGPGRGDTSEEPTPPSVDEIEPTPPDVEPTPPDAAEPTPEKPDHCKLIRDPEHGGVRCNDSNSINSVCTFWCSAGTYLAGANQISCAEDGHWSRDAPYCIRVFCEPHFEELQNGYFTCTSHNTYDSFCTFECNDGYQLIGEPTSTCQSTGQWTSPLPVCELIPIDCVVRFGNWSGCQDGGVRIREGYVAVAPNAAGVPCPEVIPVDTRACSNCVVEWEPWGVCGNGLRSRTQVITTPASGGGSACPTDLETEEEPCVDCIVEWQDWSECANEARTRRQQVVRASVGAGLVCPELQIETEDCIHCEIGWGEWEECSNDVRRRSQVIVRPAVGAGNKCPSLDAESEACIDCLVDWGAWGDCANGRRVRSEYVLVDQVGAGNACPDLQIEHEDCIDCAVSWGEWGECSLDVRTRSQVITTARVGAGEECTELQTESEICIDCQVEWGAWGECANGQRSRSQRVVVEKVGAGAECAELDVEFEDCLDCVVDWGNWGECANNVRSRSQVVVSEAVGAGRVCPALTSESEACIDCQVDWGEWSQCSGGTRTRSQEVVVEQVGAGTACPPLQDDSEVCLDCEVQWTEWSKCEDYLSKRIQVVVNEPAGAGAVCPELQTETEDCFDCEVAWENWSGCNEGGVRTRQTTILAEEIGRGAPCPPVETEEEACQNCTVEWGPWGECTNGERARTQVVANPTIGQGAPCPLLNRETEECGDCVLEWGDWGTCSNGQRERTQHISQNKIGAGQDCAEPRVESEVCIDCEVGWADWSECLDGVRVRLQYVTQEAVGAGQQCPELDTQSEGCVNCVVAWGDWGECDGSNRQRTMFVKQQPVGSGTPCPELRTETEICRDCVLEWGDFGPCINNKMSRSQFVSLPAVGAGAVCPSIQAESNPCANCVVEWGEWTECTTGRASRKQVVSVEAVGTGTPCPRRLRTENKFCIPKLQSTEAPATEAPSSAVPSTEPTPSTVIAGDTREDVLCRFVRTFLGYGANPKLRDILLLGDESGSIGWVNYEKIKAAFKMVARSVQGGIGEQESQIGMMSFSRWGEMEFGFDHSRTTNGVVDAIGRTIYHGGHRSNIGRALRDANTWMFQQSAGMRGFPGRDDNIDHEILIATDGCRTSAGYYLEQGLKKIKKRGIKLSVLAVYARDPRCQETVRKMVDDPSDLYEIGNWNELDNFIRRVEGGECRP